MLKADGKTARKCSFKRPAGPTTSQPRQKPLTDARVVNLNYWERMCSALHPFIQPCSRPTRFAGLTNTHAHSQIHIDSAVQTHFSLSGVLSETRPFLTPSTTIKSLCELSKTICSGSLHNVMKNKKEEKKQVNKHNCACLREDVNVLYYTTAMTCPFNPMQLQKLNVTDITVIRPKASKPPLLRLGTKSFSLVISLSVACFGFHRSDNLFRRYIIIFHFTGQILAASLHGSYSEWPHAIWNWVLTP